MSNRDQAELIVGRIANKQEFLVQNLVKSGQINSYPTSMWHEARTGGRYSAKAGFSGLSGAAVALRACGVVLGGLIVAGVVFLMAVPG